jgi:hypothetical protein
MVRNQGLVGPVNQTPLGQLINQFQQFCLPFNQNSPALLVAPIFGRELAQLRPVFNRHRKKAVFACLLAGDYPSAVELALGTVTAGIAAFALQIIKRALDHRLGALQMTQGSANGLVCIPDLLA